MKNQYVNGFLFSSAGEVVTLILKNKPAWQRGRLNGLGGHIEENETPLAAMTREFREESDGYNIKNWEHFCTLEGEKFQMYCFRSFNDAAYEIYCNGVEGEVGPYSSTKFTELECLTNLRWLIPMALNMPDGHRDLPYHIIEAPRTGELNAWDQ